MLHAWLNLMTTNGLQTRKKSTLFVSLMKRYERKHYHFFFWRLTYFHSFHYESLSLTFFQALKCKRTDSYSGYPNFCLHIIYCILFERLVCGKICNSVWNRRRNLFYIDMWWSINHLREWIYIYNIHNFGYAQQKRKSALSFYGSLEDFLNIAVFILFTNFNKHVVSKSHFVRELFAKNIYGRVSTLI